MDDPWRGVTRAEVAASLAFEASSGRGPGSPARLEVQACIDREAARLAALKPERKDARWTGMARR